VKATAAYALQSNFWLIIFFYLIFTKLDVRIKLLDIPAVFIGQIENRFSVACMIDISYYECSVKNTVKYNTIVTIIATVGNRDRRIQ